MATTSRGPAPKYPQLQNADWLRENYVVQAKSCPQIAAALGCSVALVELRLKQHGIKARGRHYGRWNPKTCKREGCGREYTPSGPAQQFCSLECASGTSVCEYKPCSKEFVRQKQSRKQVPYERKFCSAACQQAQRSETCSYRYFNKATGYVTVVREPTMTRGINNYGYVTINIGADNKNGGRVLEHILVMEQILGRRLLPDEEVHHKNTIKDDNDPSNLELWDTSQPKGGRVEDKLAWARELLERYPD